MSSSRDLRERVGSQKFTTKSENSVIFAPREATEIWLRNENTQQNLGFTVVE